MITGGSFAYVHARPDGTVFYVGKGDADRVKRIKRKANRHHGFIVGKYGEDNILVGVIPCSSEELAFDLEKGLIKCFKRSGVSLVNFSEGGEGQSGYRHTPESKLKMSIAAKGRKRAPETVIKMSAATKLTYAINPQLREAAAARQKAAMQDPERRRRVSAMMVNRFADPSMRLKQSEAMRGKVISDEHRYNMIKARRSRPPMSVETRSKISRSMRGKKQTPEAIEKRVTAMRAAFQRRRELRENQCAT